MDEDPFDDENTVDFTDSEITGPEITDSEITDSEITDSEITTSETYDSEGSYVCDSCGVNVVIPLDPTQGREQSYVEDCPVCCHASVIHVDWDGNHARVWAEAEQDRY